MLVQSSLSAIDLREDLNENISFPVAPRAPARPKQNSAVKISVVVNGLKRLSGASHAERCHGRSLSFFELPHGHESPTSSGQIRATVYSQRWLIED